MSRMPLIEKLKDNQGVVLVWALILSVMMIALGTAYLKFFNDFSNTVDLDIMRVQAVYAAQLALVDAFIYSNTNRPGTEYGQHGIGFYGNNSYGYTIYPSGGNEGIFSWENYKIVANGYSKDVSTGFVWEEEINYSYRYETMADYLWLTHREVDRVYFDSIYFWSPDTLDGKTHSNGTIFIHPTRNMPVFYKPVSTCMRDTYPPRNSTNARFYGGFRPNAAPIRFPDQADSVRNAARNSPYFIGDSNPDSMYYIRLYSDSLMWKGKPRSDAPFDTLWNQSHVRRLKLPLNGAVFVNGKLYIDAPRRTGDASYRGVKGRVTVGCSDTLVVFHDIYLACADTFGRVPLNCQYAVGLISEKWVMFSKYSGYPVYPNPRQFRVNAGIAALRGSMSVQGIYNFSVPEYTSLFIHGCINQQYRGIIHRGSEGYGYGFVQKDYMYDQRFSVAPPPHWIPSGNITMIYEESE